MFTTTIAVEINEKNAKAFMDSLKLVKGVKTVTDLGHQPSDAFDFENFQPPAWLVEAREMEKHPEKYKSYTDVNEMFEDILK